VDSFDRWSGIRDHKKRDVSCPQASLPRPPDSAV